MKQIIVDSGSSRARWALVETAAGEPVLLQLEETTGLNPLYVTPAQITEALTTVLRRFDVYPDTLQRLTFYGSGCAGAQQDRVRQALLQALPQRVTVNVESDLLGAALALAHTTPHDSSPFIACILGTGAIAAYFDPVSHTLTAAPALGYILGDEGSGAYLGRQLLGDFLKQQMPAATAAAFVDDFGPLTPAEVIAHVYQQPRPNRYLASFAPFLSRHLALPYAAGVAFTALDAFYVRNVEPLQRRFAPAEKPLPLRAVGGVANGLSNTLSQVAAYHHTHLTSTLADPILHLF